MNEDRRRFDPFAPARPRTSMRAVPTPAEQLPANLDDLRKADLIALAERRHLDTSGTRADLIARLRKAATG